MNRSAGNVTRLVPSMPAALMETVLEQEDLLSILDASLYVARSARTFNLAGAPTSISASRNGPSPVPSIAGSIRRKRRTASIRTDDSARLPPLLRLPSELLLDILDLSLPVENNRRSIPERNATLRSLALVHPFLTAWAQSRLYRESAIYTDTAVDKLIDLTRASKGRGGDLARTIVNLKLFGPNLSSPNTLARLVQQLPRLEELQLNDLDGLEMRAFLLLPSLRAFEARRCGFRSRFRLVAQARPSPLSTFSIINCTAHDDAFSGVALPFLRTLTLRDISLPPPSPLATLEHSEAFQSLAFEVVPHLISLTTDEHNFLLHFPLRQRRFASHRSPTSTLEHLHLVKLTHLSYLVDHLPTGIATLPLRTLQLTPSNSFLPGSASTEKADSHFESLLAPFRQRHPALEQLTELVLDEKYLIWLESGEHRVEELLKLCATRQIRTRFEESPTELERGGRTRTGSSVIRLARERRAQSVSGSISAWTNAPTIRRYMSAST
ncbi:uncharacterized protein JCM15063_000388 [Sporobolomyces koalae]|uniref:uncharacterized protein n=1 Tax=Sporobolomyces koalae TaxID=500713 RepID=UPI0031806E2F